MTGSLIQLHAKAKQNNYLISSKPDINAFKYVYKRCNQFSYDYIDIYSNNSSFFGKTVEFIIPSKSQFIQECNLKIKLPELALPSGSTYVNWTNSIGHAIIDKIELLIGEYVIDTHDGLYYELLDELTYNKEPGNINSLIRRYDSSSFITTYVPSEYIYVPIRFWFTKEVSAALPIYLLTFHSVKIKVYFKEFSQCVIYDGPTAPSFSEIQECVCITKALYISDEEINLLKSTGETKNVQYIINQMQSVKAPRKCLSDQNVILNLSSINHPVTEMLLVFLEQDSINNNDVFNFGKRVLNPQDPREPLIQKINFKIDGNDLYILREESFYRKMLPYNHHTKVPNKFIYTLPFSQKPEELNEYSGSLNFSAIDKPQLYLETSSSLGSPIYPYIYFTNYNVIDIKDGILSLKFIC